MYQRRNENKIFPNFEILDKKTKLYKTQLPWDRKTSINVLIAVCDS